MERLTSSRKGKAGTRLVYLFLEDRPLLKVLIDNERFHSETQLGGAIDAIFRAHGQDTDLLKLTMPKAVELTHSILTDIANRFMRFHGAKYLRKVLKPTVESILHRVKAGDDFGIEASRATAASLGRVLQATNEVMLNVISKADSLSPEIRVGLAALMDATEAKFGSTKRTLALGGLFWLRFICPAIVDPVQSGVLKRSPSAVGPELQRALLSLSKTVKACADGQIPENLNPAAALQLKELSVQWRPRIDACFLELRQPTGRISPRKGDYKEALVAAMSAFPLLQRRRADICAALLESGAIATLRSLEDILEMVFGGEKRSPRAISPKPESALELWSEVQVQMWLELLQFGHHKAAFARRNINGKALVSFDLAALVGLGVEQEEEQWMMLQSIRDHSTMHLRYRIASATTVRANGARSFPPLEGSLEASTSFEDSLDESSGSNSGGSLSLSNSRNSNSGNSNSGVPLSASASAPARSSGSSPATDGMNVLFKVAMKKEGMRLVRARNTDSLRTLQTSLEQELAISKQPVCYMNAAGKLVPLDSETVYKHFLATEGALANEFRVYKLYIN